MKIKLIFSILLLGLLLFIISRSIDVHKLPAILSQITWMGLLEFFAISLVISLLKAWRFLILLRNSDIKISFWEAVKTFIAGSAVTPLPGGEAMRGILLKKTAGVSFLKSTGPVIVQAYLELLSATIFFLLGSLLYRSLRLPAIIVFCMMILIATFLINRNFFLFVSNALGKLAKLSKFLRKLKLAQLDIRDLLYDSDTHLPDKILIRTLSLSLLANVAGGFLIFLIALNLHQDLHFYRSIFVYAGGQVIQGIGTISPGGLGFTESGMVGLLLLSNIQPTQAIAIVLLFRLYTLFLNVLIGLLFLAIFYSKSLLSSKKAAVR